MFFVPAVLSYMFTLLFLPSSSVSLFPSIFPLPIQCREQHWCMSSSLPIDILNGIFCFAKLDGLCLGRRFACQKQIMIIIGIFVFNTIE